MISMAPDDVKQLFGSLVVRKLPVMVVAGDSGGQAREAEDLYGGHP